MQKPGSILVVKLSAIGDVVMATPLAETLRNAYPDAHLAWLVEERCKDVIEGNPYLDEIIVWKRVGGVRAAMPQISDLRSRRFDVAIDMQGLARSAALAFLSGAKTRIGFREAREFSSLLYNVKVTCGGASPGMMSHRYLAEPLGIPTDCVSSSMFFPLSETLLCQSRSILEAAGITQEQKYPVLAPATTRPNKHWLEPRWSELATDLSTRFGLTLVFLGSRANVDLIERIRSRSRAESVSFAGATSIKSAGAILNMASLTVSVDTGLTHISVALGVPTVAVFGPTFAWTNHVGNANFRVVRKELPCAPCRKNVTCENYDCMAAVSVDDVIKAVDSLLGERYAVGVAEKSQVTC